MIQSFKRLFWRNILDPRMVLFLFLLPLYLAGLYFLLPAIWLPAMLLMFLSLLWVKFRSIPVGENFVALPALPGKPQTICQRKSGKRTCPQQLQSLLRDSCLAADTLPAGSYQTLTNEAVLKRMERAGLTILELRPAYRSTLRPVLLCQTGKQCRGCTKQCLAWDTPARQFYLVKFDKL